MSIETNEQATDAILQTFKRAWVMGAAAVNNGQGVPEVEWPNLPLVDEAGRPKKPLSEGNKPWARIVVRHNSGYQRSLGEPTMRRFTREGKVMVQIFVPAGKRGSGTGERLGNVALGAFEGNETAGADIWFRNAVQREAGIDGNWYQVNVMADFEYDVVK